LNSACAVNAHNANPTICADRIAICMAFSPQRHKRPANRRWHGVDVRGSAVPTLLIAMQPLIGKSHSILRLNIRRNRDAVGLQHLSFSAYRDELSNTPSGGSILNLQTRAGRFPLRCLPCLPAFVARGISPAFSAVSIPNVVATSHDLLGL
jgi:hypothetical protein